MRYRYNSPKDDGWTGCVKKEVPATIAFPLVFENIYFAASYFVGILTHKVAVRLQKD